MESVATLKSWPEAFDDAVFREQFTRTILPAYLKKCRWFAGKARKLKDIRVKEEIHFKTGESEVRILIIDAYYRSGKLEQYLLPVVWTALEPESPEKSVILKINNGYLVDAIYDAHFQQSIFFAMQENRRIKDGEHSLFFEKGSAFEFVDRGELVSSRVTNFDQSNTSLFFGDRYFFKFYRKLFRETNPELESVRFLCEEGGFTHIPTYVASISLKTSKRPEVTLGIMQKKVEAEGEVWQWLQDQMTDYFRGEGLSILANFSSAIDCLQLKSLPVAAKQAQAVLPTHLYAQLGLLGRRTAGMHNAFAHPSKNSTFSPVAFDHDYSIWLSQHFDQLLEKRQYLLADNLTKLSVEGRALAEVFRTNIDRIRAFFESFQDLEATSKRIRIHGDYHLGQVLIQNGDYIILDFEGEPESSIRDRKVKHSPLKDVAGMLRSFHYAAYVALIFGPLAKNDQFAVESKADLAEKWYNAIASVFLHQYFEALATDRFQLSDTDEASRLLQLHLLEKAVYELGYELNGRPDWVIIPLQGIHQILKKIT